MLPVFAWGIPSFSDSPMFYVMAVIAVVALVGGIVFAIKGRGKDDDDEGGDDFNI